jgi:hypothetical protein
LGPTRWSRRKVDAPDLAEAVAVRVGIGGNAVVLLEDVDDVHDELVDLALVGAGDEVGRVVDAAEGWYGARSSAGLSSEGHGRQEARRRTHANSETQSGFLYLL